jgi:hypothetical protein
MPLCINSRLRGHRRQRGDSPRPPRRWVLGGLSSQENRRVPPLRPDVVRWLKRCFPPPPMVLDGGLRSAERAQAALA